MSVLTLPDGGYCVAQASQVTLGNATDLTFQILCKVDAFLSALDGEYNLFLNSVDTADHSAEKTQAWFVPIDATTGRVKFSSPVGALQSLAIDFSGLSVGDYIWIVYGYYPTIDQTYIIDVRELDGTLISHTGANTLDSTPFPTGPNMGLLMLSHSVYFQPEASQSRSMTRDGFCIYSGPITTLQQHTVPDPNGAGVIWATSFTGNTGDAVVHSDTTGGGSLDIFVDVPSVGTPYTSGWASGGIWNAPSVGIPPGVLRALDEDIMGIQRVTQRGTNPKTIKAFILRDITTLAPVHGKAAADITATLTRNGNTSNATAITVTDIGYADSARTDGGWAEHATINGAYRFDPPAAAAVAGSDGATAARIEISCAGCVPFIIDMPLTDYAPDIAEDEETLETGVTQLQAKQRMNAILYGESFRCDVDGTPHSAGLYQAFCAVGNPDTIRVIAKLVNPGATEHGRNTVTFP